MSAARARVSDAGRGGAARVLVTDAGRGSAIAVIRSLGRRGVHVIAADHAPGSAGFRSRYAAETLLYPDPLRDPLEVVEQLHALAAAGRVDLIVPVSDDVLLPLASARERFAGLAALAIPDDAALEQVADKAATVALARRLDVPVPRSVVVHQVDEALRAADGLGWPVVLKPTRSRVITGGGIERLEVAYADSRAELVARMPDYVGRCPVLLQEYIAGDGQGVELLLDHGRPLMAFQHRRLHEVPVTGGASALRESVALSPALVNPAIRLMEALRWTGLAMVEFRVGASGPVLMEVNGRIWGSLPLAVKSGVDFPLGLATLHLGPRLGTTELARPRAPLIGVRSRDLGRELVWIASVLRRRRRYAYLEAPGRRAALVAAARLPLPQDGYDVLCRDDPMPGVLDVFQAARRVARKVAHAS